MSENHSDISNDLSIRRYESRDRAALVALNHTVLVAAGIDLGDGPTDAGVRDIESEYINSGGEFLVGEYEGRMVAMGGIQKTGPETAKVRRMRVDPDLQRHGFGTAILIRLQNRALELGFKRLWLDTNVNFESALKFYARHGYRQTHEEGTGDDKHIYFEKVLTPPGGSG